MLYGNHAGKMSVNAHGLFWATGKKKVKNLDFSRIWGFHKNLLIKPSFSYTNAPNSN